MCEWIPISEEPPPQFTAGSDKDFLAAWIDEDGRIEGIEWYTLVGDDWWCQNSCNLHELGKPGMSPLPTHWMPMPRKVRT